MEGLNKLDYSIPDTGAVETDIVQTLRFQLSQGLDDESVLSWRIPADPTRFTDLNTILLRLEVTLQLDGADPPDGRQACLDENGMHSIFSSCDVRFNDVVVSSMQSYPYTSKLCRMLGASSDVREKVWDTLDGTRSPELKKSNTQTNDAGAIAVIKSHMDRIEKKAILIGRVYSDVLMSARQFLPPGVSLGIDLRRAPDAFALMSNAAHSFKLHISNASLYVTRLRLRPSLVPKALDESGSSIAFNRLETRMITIPKGSKNFWFLNCLNNGPLPNRIYVAFVEQTSAFGTVTQASTFFENLGISRLNVKHNGRDVLVEPISTKFENNANGIDTSKSDASNGYLSLVSVFDQVRDQLGPVRLTYSQYLKGNTIFAVELGKWGESQSNGSLDIEMDFGGDGISNNAVLLLFSEKSDWCRVVPRNL